MEVKNLCGKIPLELHTKVRAEIEQREISTHEFLQQVIEEHFMGKGVDSMVARTIAVQVTEELFNRLKAVIAKKGCKQKDFLIGIIEKAVKEAEEELEKDRLRKAAMDCQQEEPQEEASEQVQAEAGREPSGVARELEEDPEETASDDGAGAAETESAEQERQLADA